MAQISLDSIQRIDKQRNTIHEKFIPLILYSKWMEINMCSLILMDELGEKIQKKLASHFNWIENLQDIL